MTDSDGFQRIGDLWAYAQLSEGGQGKSFVRAQRPAAFSDSLHPDNGPSLEADRPLVGRQGAARALNQNNCDGRR
jgi:hypothetical protein